MRESRQDRVGIRVAQMPQHYAQEEGRHDPQKEEEKVVGGMEKDRLYCLPRHKSARAHSIIRSALPLQWRKIHVIR